MTAKAATLCRGAALLVCVSGAHAAPEYGTVKLGEGSYLKPALRVEERYDDNIFQLPDDEEDDFVTTIEPALELAAGRGLNRFSLLYEGDYGVYADSTEDDYDDHLVRGDAHFEGGVGFIELYGGFAREHDDRGTGPSNGFGDFTTTIFEEPTEFDAILWGGGIGLGNPQSRGRVALRYDGSDLEYQNLRSLTRARDRQRHDASVTLAYELTGKTDVAIDGRWSDIEYDFTPAGAVALDSQEIRVQAGLEWQATGKTSGEVKLGYVDKDFDDGAREDQDDFAWELAITWAPQTYSVFDLYTRRGFRETDNFGSAITATEAGLDWNHEWSSRVSSAIGLAFVSEDFEANVREDDFFRFELAFDYDWERWFTMGAGVRIVSRDSSVQAADFDRNIVFVSADLSL